MLKRHQAFISSHLISGAVALLLYPVYLIRAGGPGVLDLLVLAWFVSPIAIAAYLCRTGNLAVSYLISSLNLAVFVVVGAALTGGLQSFLLAWLIIIPLEAALSGNKKVIMTASAAALMALLSLALLGQFDLIITQNFSVSQEGLMMFGLFTALLYGSSIALTVQKAHDDAQAVIKENQHKYQIMADHATDVISVHDEFGMVTFISPAAQSLTGRDGDELLGAGMLKNIHIADRPIYMTALSNCLNINQAVNVEYRLKCTAPDRGELDPDGSAPSSTDTTDPERYIWVEMRCRAINDVFEPGTKKIISVTRDVSSHKAQEIALLEAREHAEGANVAKTRFLANMSHELRTPLNAIIGFSDVLAMELCGKLENQKHKDYSRLINDAGTHLLSVVNNILDMSKIEVGNFTIISDTFELEPLLSSCSQMVAPIAADNCVTIEEDFDPALEELYADSRAVKQMVLNILSNAIKFSHVDGTIILRTRQEEAFAYIEVIDQGIGIAPQDLPKLCNPFVQADSSYKREHEGVGLGLSVVKGLAQLHGGSFTLDSELGAGTTATIALPKGPIAAGDLTEEELADQKPYSSGKDKLETCVVPLKRPA